MTGQPGPDQQRPADGPGRTAEHRLARWLPAPARLGPAAEPGRGERRAWRIVGVLVLACALLAGAATTGAALVQRESTQEKTYFGAIDRLDIDSGPAQVTVRPGGTDRVVVTERIGWSVRRPTVAERTDAGTLSIAVGCPGGRTLLGCTVALEIQVPAATEVHSRNSSGRTEILDLAGAVSAETDSGQVELTRVSGPIRANAGSGQILGTGLGSADADLSSSSGPITVQYDRAPNSVTARLASGDLVLQVPDDRNRYRLQVITDNGREQIAPSVQSSSSPRLLDLTAASGNITVNRGNDR